MTNTSSRVVDIIAEQFGIERSSITPDTHLVNDLGAEDLDRVELQVKLEDEFQTQINDDAFDRCQTVNSIQILVIDALY